MPTSISLTTVFAGREVRIWRPKWKRYLECVCGEVGRLAPVVLRYKGGNSSWPRRSACARIA